MDELNWKGLPKMKNQDRATAFSEAANICRARAKDLFPVGASSLPEFDSINSKIEELETLAHLFDHMGIVAKGVLTAFLEKS